MEWVVSSEQHQGREKDSITKEGEREREREAKRKEARKKHSRALFSEVLIYVFFIIILMCCVHMIGCVQE